MTTQEKLFAAIRQVKLKPRLLTLLDEGLTMETIQLCIKEHKETGITRAEPGLGPKRTQCPHKARKAITNAKYD